MRAEKKDKRLSVSLTESELNAIEEVAEGLGMTVSAFMRQAALERLERAALSLASVRIKQPRIVNAGWTR
jgi:uncharacterized protein (DUF1778 family)